MESEQNPEPELKTQIKELLEVSKENNILLRKLWKSHRLAMAMRVFYWVLIIGATFGAYYFIQPYLEQLLGVYTQGVSSLDELGNFKDSIGGGKDFNELLKDWNNNN